MPKIRITETVEPSPDLLAAISNTVYVPGKGAGNVAVDPVLFRTVTDFTNSVDYEEETLSYVLAKHLLALGIYVLYEGVTEEDGVPVIDWGRLEDKGLYDIRFLTTGGYACPTEEMCTCAKNRGDCVALLDHPKELTDVEATVSGNVYAALSIEPVDWAEHYTDYYTRDDAYDALRALKPYKSNKYYEKETIDSVEVYTLLTGPKPTDWSSQDWTTQVKYYESAGYEYTPVPTGEAGTVPTFEPGKYFEKLSNDSTVVERVRAYFESVVTSVSGSYCAAFTPWFNSTTQSLLYTDTLVNVDIPASFGYLFAYANSLTFNPEWYAVAGSYRGIITELSNVLKDYSSAECEMLQGRSATAEVNLDEEGDNVGIAINPIAYVRPFGYIIWGNRTLQYNNGATNAVSFLNVRNLVCTIKKALYNAARKYTFEQNGEVLWVRFMSQVRPFLDQMQSGNGIAGYRFTRLETKAKARLAAKITIIPIEAVEDFDLEVELADSIEVVE